MKNYLAFDAEDFAADERFIAWVKNPTEENQHFWKSWLASNPEKEEAVLQARKMVAAIDFYQYPKNEASFQKVWQQVQANKSGVSEKSSRSGKVISIKHWYGVAASLLLLLTVSFGVYQYLQPKTYVTGFQEKQEILLPDGSLVYLNANSTLRLASDWEVQREVWLDGEAFFEIEKIEAGQKMGSRFIVHTREVDVEVLGTKFNVQQRREKTQVVLNSGKVKLNMPGLDKEMLMSPGELVELSHSEGLVKKLVEPQAYSAWKDNKLVFDNVSLDDIAVLLEENYGYEVEIQPQSLAEKRFKGSSPADNLNVLFVSLEATLDVKISKGKNSILIEKNKLPGPEGRRLEP